MAPHGESAGVTRIKRELAQYRALEELNREMSNHTEEELAAIFDPTLPKPPPRKIYPSPCECTYICSQQYRLPSLQSSLQFSYSKEIDDNEARGIAASHKASIDDSLAHLRSKCAVRGKIISSRWKKKSRDKRATIILAADPGLEHEQWALLKYMSNNRSFEWQKARDSRNTFLLSWLNVDSLKSDPAQLLGLLNNRTRFSPEEWAPYDNDNLLFGYNQGFLEINYSPLSMVMYGSKYGELVPWEESAAHRLDTIGFPRGRLILEAQDTLLRFLCRMVDQLTEGLEETQPQQADPSGADLPLHIPKVEFKQSGRIEMWSKYINQPFAEPPVFDIEYFTSLTRAMVNEYGDHIWLLQTDPAYMRRTVRMLTAAAPLETNSLGKDQASYLQAIQEINMDNGSYHVWKIILEDLETIKGLKAKYGDGIQPGNPLPEEYSIAIQSLDMYLSQQLKARELALEDSFPQRSGFRDLFEFRHSGGEIQWRLKHGSRYDSLWDGIFFTTQPLYWCVSNIFSHPKDRLKFEPSTVLAFLDEHLANCSKDERARMDERLYSQLSEYAAFNEISFSLRLHRPGTGRKLSVSELKKVSKSRAYKASRDDKVTQTIQTKHGKSLGLMQPFTDFLEAYDSQAHVGKRPDQTRLRYFDNVQESLSTFWKKKSNLERELLKGSKVPEEEIQNAMQLLSARSTPQFTQSLQQERQKLIDEIERVSKPKSISSGQLQTEWGSSQEAATKAAEPTSSKIKRRREQQSVETSNTETPQEPEHPDIPPLPVKQQTYTILNGMFTTNPEATTKTVDWDAFVTAMADTGFTARHSSGSAVIFEPEHDDWERGWVGKIVFHKPHPVAKIDSISLRIMGKRMERWFGWTKDTFVVQQ